MGEGVANFFDDFEILHCFRSENSKGMSDFDLS